MSGFEHYLKSGLKSIMTLMITTPLILLCFFLIIFGVVKGNLILIFVGIIIIGIVVWIGEYFMKKNKVRLHAGNTYVTRYRDY